MTAPSYSLITPTTLLLLIAVTFSQCGSMAAENSTEPAWKLEYGKIKAEENSTHPGARAEQLRKTLEMMKSENHNQADEEMVMRSLADSLMLANKTAEALSVYQNLLSEMTRHYGERSPKLAPVLMVLGSVQEACGDHSAAMVYYQRALKLNEKNYGPYSPEFAGSLHAVGRAGLKNGDKAQARKNYKRALSILSQEAGLDASHELKSLLKDYNDLIKTDDQSDKDLIKDFNRDIYGNKPPLDGGSSAGNSGTNGSSSWTNENSFKLRAQTEGQVNEDSQVALRGLNIDRPGSEQVLAPVFKTMNDTIFNQSHFEKGEDYYKRKIAIDVDSLGPNHPSVANDLSGLAVFYMLGGKYTLAKPLLARALPIYQKAWGESNVLTVNATLSLASCEFHTGNAEAAAKLYRQALSKGQSLGPNSLETARALNDLGYLYYHQGKLQDACTFYEWALASTEKAVGPRDPLLAACLKDYAQVLSGMGKKEAASAAEIRADNILTNAKPSASNR